MNGGGLIKRAIERPVSVLVGVVMLLMFGALSLLDLPIQLTPDVTIPTVSVSTNWAGAAPTEIEAEILERQEEALKSIPGLKKMTSEASSDRGSVNLEFEVGTSIEETLVRVTNRLASVPGYPLTAKQPIVSTARSTGPPLAVGIIHSSTATPVGHYRTWVDERIIPVLERIRGVATVRLIGGRRQELQIAFDPAALAARGVTVAMLAQAIRSELRDVSAGDVSIGKRRLVVRTPLAPKKAADFEQIVLKTDSQGNAIRVGDVAKAKVAFHKLEAQAFADGKRSMALLFFREAGSNVLEVTQKIRATVADLQSRLMAAEGLSFTIVSDQTHYINSALGLVRQNLLLGGGLAVIVLLFFLRSFTAAAVVSIAIPICTIGTALGMALVGRSVNVVSLAGMAFAVGMVVDNAIVVLENIHSRRQIDDDPRRAALVGTRQVWGAILASTLTTAAVFIPIIGWQDVVGELLRDVAVAISVAVFVSLIVSVLVIPSFSAKLLRDPPKSDTKLARFGERFRQRIAGQVGWVVKKKRRALLVATLALSTAAGLGLWLLPPLEYLPTGTRNIVFGILIPPAGYSVQEMSRIGEQIQKETVAHTGKEVGGVPAIARSFYVGTRVRAFMGVVAVDEERAGEFVPFLRGIQAKIPGVFGIATRASLFGRRIGGGRSIEIEISGPKIKQLIGVAGPMLGAVKKILPKAQVRPIPTLELGAPELRVLPKRRQLARMGFSGADLGLIVDALIDGALIGELSRKGDPRLDVMLLARGGGVRTPEGLAAAPVATPKGETVSLGTLATIRERLGPSVIQRIERRRAITLQVSPPKTVPLEAAMKMIRAQVVEKFKSAGKIPQSVRVALSGEAGDLASAKERFGWILLLAVIICFLLLAALFENLIAPLAVLVTVPLAGAGGVLALRLVDATIGRQPLDMMTSVGFVILVGVVVNNAILVVDGSLTRLREGKEIQEACADAVRARVRPIFMSATTSLAGLLPMVLLPGAGSELYRGVGAIVLGGLALSTVLTLYVVPAVFVLLWRNRPAPPAP